MPRLRRQPAEGGGAGGGAAAATCPDIVIDTDGVWELVGSTPNVCEYKYVMPYPLVIDSIPFG